MSAITASKRGRKVLVLEKSNKVGKKILMSGGGRCNFTNEFVDSDNFISQNKHFCKSALNGFSSQDFVNLVDQHAIEYEIRKRNQFFCQGSSKNILDMLLKECDAGGVDIQTHTEINHIRNVVCNENNEVHSFISANRFVLEGTFKLGSNQRYIEYSCKSLIVATGALSVPTLGGSGYGYDIAEQFDLSITEKYAGLVPFVFTDSLKPIFSRLSGVSTLVQVECNGHVFLENMLFTHRGLSGPAMLQISNYWSSDDRLLVNLIPNVDPGKELVRIREQGDKRLIRSYLTEYLPKSLVIELQSMWWPKHSELPINKINPSELINIGYKLNNWIIKPSGTEGFRTAEVTVGGVSTDGINSKTMEVKNQPGLYFVGEVLDVSGQLGGFNFQWAWSSGFAAGRVA
ncbi:aminoacetone oxidase family FAD-binding enzyme [SAR202 cluster bacterium AC-409-J13_OGT_754m]|nr:aminoacetone oxidase family FAD-binding enzyme [SAR202 cluster bacterium AC-409-J13_OGT_754m]